MSSAGATTIVIAYPHSLGAGGGGTLGCIEISRHLKAAGADVIVAPVMTMSNDRKLFRPAPLSEEHLGTAEEQLLTDAGVEIHRIDPHPVHWYLDAFAVRKAIRSIVAERRVDAALGWHHEFALMPRLLHKHGVTAGLFVSGWYEDYGNILRAVPDLRGRIHLRIQRDLLLKSLRKVDVVVAISEFTKREVSESLGVPPERFQVAHWGVNPVFEKTDRVPEDKIERFLFFGSPAIRKGGFQTLEAFAEVAARGHHDWHLKMIWTRREELEKSARERGIADRVTVLDPMDQASIAREMAWAQVAVLPSTFESFGLACAEAQLNSIPVIAYDNGGVSEVVRDGISGWLVENDRPDLLPDPIIDAMRDPGRTHRMGVAGHEHVSGLYSWDRTAKTILGRIRALRGQSTGTA